MEAELADLKSLQDLGANELKEELEQRGLEMG